jgi:enterochelin esterase family protein
VTRGRVVLDRIDSRVLAHNPLGDPSSRALPVYLPPGYDDSKTKRYPTLYLLAGFAGSGPAMLNRSAFGEAIDQRLDRLIGAGAMKPCVVVLPDCMTSFGGSQYLSSRATGRYEEHLAVELVRFVDARYRTLAGASHRGVAGKSSGGYGALVHAMKHPDVFGACASHSGDIGFELGYMPDFPKAATDIGKAGGLVAWMKRFRASPKKSHAQFTTMNVVAMAACYSPHPKLPFGLELPFDVETAEIVPRVWEKWLEQDPLRMLAGHAKALRALRLLYLDAGTKDEFNLHFGARRFAKRARALGVRVVHEEFDDGHMDTSYRYDVSLPKLAAVLSRR